MRLLRQRSPREMALGVSMVTARPRGQPPGSYIADLAALGKVIALCGQCEPKFDAFAYDYVTRRDLPFARGYCDGCCNMSERNALFFKQGHY